MTSLIFNFSGISYLICSCFYCCCIQNRSYRGVIHVSANPTQPQGRVLREAQSIPVNPGQPRRLGEVQLETKQDVESIMLDVEKILQNSLSCSDCVICLDSFDVAKNDHDVDNGGVKVLEQCGHSRCFFTGSAQNNHDQVQGMPSLRAMPTTNTIQIQTDYFLEEDPVILQIDKEKRNEITRSCLDCVICLDSFESYDTEPMEVDGEVIPIRRTFSGTILSHCGHRFHTFCINSWYLRTYSTCPICRGPITYDDLISGLSL